MAFWSLAERHMIEHGVMTDFLDAVGPLEKLIMFM
jgi:hypothetical protein